MCVRACVCKYIDKAIYRATFFSSIEHAIGS